MTTLGNFHQHFTVGICLLFVCCLCKDGIIKLLCAANHQVTLEDESNTLSAPWAGGRCVVSCRIEQHLNLVFAESLSLLMIQFHNHQFDEDALACLAQKVIALADVVA